MQQQKPESISRRFPHSFKKRYERMISAKGIPQPPSKGDNCSGATMAGLMVLKKMKVMLCEDFAVSKRKADSMQRF
ncbi:hypothetical protein DCM91_11980 [Chitinophaga costaii]|nr:hypothetical protein DCM91_11980 [Chitinophaga costaii]